MGTACTTALYVKQNGTQDERRAKLGNRYEMWDMYIAGEGVERIASDLQRWFPIR